MGDVRVEETTAVEKTRAVEKSRAVEKTKAIWPHLRNAGAISAEQIERLLTDRTSTYALLYLPVTGALTRGGTPVLEQECALAARFLPSMHRSSDRTGDPA